MPNSPPDSSVTHLQSLIGFPSVSLTPNADLMAYVEGVLHACGITTTRFAAPDDPARTNLLASVGPSTRSGVLLSGHTDVVPVIGQPWSTPPFVLTESEGRFYGRGTADMKGFVACALSAMQAASRRELQRPLQLALSFDEEIGCVGVRHMLGAITHQIQAPLLCIIGEPTLMTIGTGHKGKAAYRASCCGQAGHSGLAPLFANAIHMATDLVSALRDVQREIAEKGPRDPGYTVPYTTVHVGTIQGGTALNIVPSACEVNFEIRTVLPDDPADILQRVMQQLARRVQQQDPAPEAPVPEVTLRNSYPGLHTTSDSPAVALLSTFLPSGTACTKVDYGSEGGLFQKRWQDTPVLICGPGSITVAHKADEYVDASQLQACDRMLHGLVDFLCQPLHDVCHE
jgi:acetylornithine deacetylase